MNRRIVVIAEQDLGLAELPCDQEPELAGVFRELLLKDTIALCQSLNLGPLETPPALVLAYGQDRMWYQQRVSGFWLLLPQMGNTLAQCLDNVLIALAPAPDDETIFLGCRAPHLPTRVLQHTFSALSRFDSVIGPCERAGIYLLGVRGRWPAGILGEVQWAGTRTANDLRKKLTRARLGCGMLDKTYPLMGLDDVRRLTPDLINYPHQALSNVRWFINSKLPGG